MVKYRIEEEKVYDISNGYYILTKRHWWSFWKYLRNEDRMVIKFDTRRKAQAYVNFRLNKGK